MHSENKKYIFWLDFIRVTSIFLVIIIHASNPLYNRWKDLPVSDWMAGNIYNSLARISVPLLFMVSGYLLLSRQESIRSFYANRVQKVVVPILVWSVIYLIWRNDYSNFTFFNAVKSMLYNILTGPVYYHLWFVYALLSIYLFTPILRLFIYSATPSALWYFAAIWFVFGPLIDSLEQKYLNFHTALDLGFFTSFIGYFYLGYLFGRLKFPRWAANSAGAIFAALTIYTIFGAYKLSAANNGYVEFYHNYLRLNIVIMAVCAFVWMKSFGERLGARLSEPARRWVRSLSGASFGIYLIHAMLLLALRKGAFGFTLNTSSASPFIMVPLLAVIVFFVSYPIVIILQRIPYIRAIVPK